MSKEFRERIKALKAEYPEMTLDEKKAYKRQLKRRNKLTYYRCETMRRDILRLEAKRSQLLVEGNEKQVLEIEQKILDRKKQWMDVFYSGRKIHRGR